MVVAMSGGVDSSVTAALLAEAGLEVVGITLQLYDHGAATGRKNACCAGQDIQDARAVAAAIGIAHYVLDFEERFRASVIDDFVDSYAEGRTPVPCIRCNQRVKFRDLLEIARDLGASALATGHYARRTSGPAGAELWRGIDHDKDQSYFLFATTQQQLEFLRLPLGILDKQQTRAEAERLALPVARKPESQDICFVPHGRYDRLVRKLRPDRAVAGDVHHVDGRFLGRHGGIVDYTVGQRRGLKVATGERLYVTALEADRARVVVGPRDTGLSQRIILKDLNRLDHGRLDEPARGLMIKHRYNEAAVTGAFAMGSNGSGIVTLDEPQFGVAPGQACVLYDGDCLLGGGWIEKTERPIVSQNKAAAATSAPP